MNSISIAVQPTLDAKSKKSAQSTWTKVVKIVRRRPLGAVAAVIIVTFLIVSLLAPWLAPYDPFKINPASILNAPNLHNWMGTDEYGRDVMSRIIWGSRVSLLVGLLSVCLGTTTGAIIGLICGYFGGKVDYVLQRLMDVLMAFPGLILALAMVAALGASIHNVVIALSLTIIPGSSRVIRSSAIALRQSMFVDAARNLGYSHARIVFRHIMPNCVAPYIIIATSALGSAILAEAGLSFLGLGTPPPSPSWGGMLSGSAQRFMSEAPWLAVFPGLAITTVVLGFSFLGDALRDLLDPRLRSR